MGTGWRRAFCTTIPDDRSESIASEKPERCASPSPRSCVRFAFLSGGSNSSTPRLRSQPIESPTTLRCQTIEEASKTSVTPSDSQRTQCKATKATKSPRALLGSSNSSSPCSPLKLSGLYRNGFKFRNSCGICYNSVKAGQGVAIYTAECAHAFHFPCIAAHVKKQASLVCPVCNAAWSGVPLLTVHKDNNPESLKRNAVVSKSADPGLEDKKMIESQSQPLSPPCRAVKTKQEQERQQMLKTLDSRSYDDDEPLLSPTACPRILPIPEADENGEEEADNEAEEFQGFFVNPSQISSTKCKSEAQIIGRELKSNVKVTILPESAMISAGRTHETFAVSIRVTAQPPPLSSTTAPVLDPSHRAAIDLVTVLDVSGSMTGSKFRMLKRAMRSVISSLGSADRLSIVAFCATTRRLLRLKRMTVQGQRAARRIVDRLVCSTSQGTSVGDALAKATKVLEDRREKNPVARIMLLSDGQDERTHNGVKYRRQPSRHESSTRYTQLEIPVHEFGFGETGGGSQEPPELSFAKCVGGTLSVVVQDLRVELGLPSDSSPAEISAVYCYNGVPTLCGSASAQLGDLNAEEETELLVELRVPKAFVGTHHVMSVRWVHRDPATQETVSCREQAIVAALSPAVRSTPPEIERLRNRFITTRAIAESRRLIEHNDCRSAHRLLSSARALVMQSSSYHAEEYVRGLETEMAVVHWRRQQQQRQQNDDLMMIQRRRGSEREMMLAFVGEDGEELTPTSAWRLAERLAKVAMMKKSLHSRVSDLHGFENARF